MCSGAPDICAVEASVGFRLLTYVVLCAAESKRLIASLESGPLFRAPCGVQPITESPCSIIVYAVCSCTVVQ